MFVGLSDVSRTADVCGICDHSDVCGIADVCWDS